jgi:hypothetical protein
LDAAASLLNRSPNHPRAALTGAIFPASPGLRAPLMAHVEQQKLFATAL